MRGPLGGALASGPSGLKRCQVTAVIGGIPAAAACQSRGNQPLSSPPQPPRKAPGCSFNPLSQPVQTSKLNPLSSGPGVAPSPPSLLQAATNLLD